MAFDGATFSKLFGWDIDPVRAEKIFNARLEAEFGGIANALSLLKGWRVTPDSFDTAGIQAAIDSVPSGESVLVFLPAEEFDMSGGNVSANGRIVSFEIDPRATFTGSGTLPGATAPSYSSILTKYSQQSLIRGSASDPVTTEGPVVAIELHSASTTGGSSQNPAFVAIAHKYTSADNSRVMGAFFEAVEHEGWDGTGANSFVEGIRAHGTVAADAVNGTAMGVIAVGQSESGGTVQFLFGAELICVNNDVDAPLSDSFSASGFTAGALASAGFGTKLVDAGFLVNPNDELVATGGQFRTGFMVPDGGIKDDGSAFYCSADCWMVLDARLADPAISVIAAPNNRSIIRARSLDGTENHDLMTYQSDHALWLGQEADSIVLKQATDVEGDLTWDGAASTTTTPTPTASSGTLTSASSTVRTKKLGRLVHSQVSATVTTAGTGTGTLNVTLPFTAAADSFLYGWRAGDGKIAFGFIQAGTSFVAILGDSFSTLISSGASITVSGAWEATA